MLSATKKMYYPYPNSTCVHLYKCMYVGPPQRPLMNIGVRTYVCMYVRIYMYIYVCMYSMYVCMYVHIIYICMHEWMNILDHVCMYIIPYASKYLDASPTIILLSFELSTIMHGSYTCCLSVPLPSPRNLSTLVNTIAYSTWPGKVLSRSRHSTSASSSPALHLHTGSIMPCRL